MKVIEAIIFDLDGTLVDTEPLHCASYVEVLRANGVELSDEDYYEHWTKNGKGIKDFLQGNRIDLDVEKLRHEKRELYHSRLRTSSLLIDGVIDTLFILNRKYFLAVATSSYKHDAESVLQIAGLTNYFEIVITADDVKKEKPAPECFLLASQKLNISPENILVVEDSEKGIIAAYNAGMKSIAIPNKYTKNHNFSLASRILENILEINLDLLEELGK